MAQDQQLSTEQRGQLEQIAAGDSVHSQRAQALLALDGGATQVAAAQEAGLSISSVRYWRNKFMDQGMAIFPEGMGAESASEEAKPDKKKKKKKGDKKKKGAKKRKSKKKGKKKKKKKK